jgi:1,4-alpha-glucan branching enzyme
MENDDRWDDQVREAYQRPLPGEDEARERAIARLRRERRPPRRAIAWWIDPAALRLPPLAAAASVVALLLLGAWAGAMWMRSQSRSSAAPVATIATEPSTPVTFVFRAPGASTVTLVGDFNGWDPDATPLRRAALSDAWTAQVPMPRGLHAYAFVIDGREWAPDPSAPLAPEATFGRRNSVLVVGEGVAL